MAKKHYPPDELELRDSSEEEQIRTREIFDDLKSKAQKGENLFEREKEFLCVSLKLTLYEGDGRPEDFDFCKEFIFRELYLTYFHNDLAGPFFKAKKGKIVEVADKEKLKDFKTLQRISDRWIKEIEIQNHPDQVLQELASETRKDLKELDKRYPKLLRRFKKKQDEYKLKKDKIILQSKFIYLLTKTVIEDYDTKDFEIPFSKEIIEFTPYSLIHITSRHYAEPIKDRADKTYHYKNFLPKDLHLDIKAILTEIDKLNILDIKKTNNIIFKYDKIIYHLWIEKKTKQVKGKGNIVFNRIQSFFPIYNKTKLEEIDLQYDSISINSLLSVFIKK